MPLTIKNVSKQGRFELVAEDGTTVGFGRAKPSKANAGMVTLFFPDRLLYKLSTGLRIPINWLDVDYQEGED